MSEHRASIRWQRASPGFSYEEYNREHDWAFDGGATVHASAAPAFRGRAEGVDPEEALVASIASCHMLTFLAIAARRRLVVDDYVDEAVGHMEKNERGKLAVTRVELHPRIRFGDGAAPSAEELAKLHALSHEECFIANSVRTHITIG
jgi:organic hydroperoxide reductase OsmC/OhrA